MATWCVRFTLKWWTGCVLETFHKLASLALSLVAFIYAWPSFRSNAAGKTMVYSRDEKYSGHRYCWQQNSQLQIHRVSGFWIFSCLVCRLLNINVSFWFVLCSLLTFLVCIEFISRLSSAYGWKRPTYASNALCENTHSHLGECEQQLCARTTIQSPIVMHATSDQEH